MVPNIQYLIFDNFDFNLNFGCISKIWIKLKFSLTKSARMARRASAYKHMFWSFLSDVRPFRDCFYKSNDNLNICL